MMSEFSEKRRASFQRQMRLRVEKLVSISHDSDILNRWHLEFLYEPDLNFGEFFRVDRKKLVSFERAYFEACDNAPSYVAPMLIVSRPHDNYYLVADDDDLRNVPLSLGPLVMWTLQEPGRLEHRHLIMMNLKSWINA